MRPCSKRSGPVITGLDQASQVATFDDVNLMPSGVSGQPEEGGSRRFRRESGADATAATTVPQLVAGQLAGLEHAVDVAPDDVDDDLGSPGTPPAPAVVGGPTLPGEP